MIKTSTFKTSTTLFASLAFLLVSITSCSKKNEVTGTAYVQVTNASELDSPMDFYVDANNETSTPLSYQQSSGYFSVTTGSHSAGFKTHATGASLAGFTITPQTGLYYSVFYFGGFTVAYQDDLTAPTTGNARVRFTNLNLGLTSNLDYAVSGGATLATALTNKLNSDYYNVAPGSTFTVTISGTQTVLLTIPTNIAAGHIYTIYLSGQTLGDLEATVLLQK